MPGSKTKEMVIGRHRGNSLLQAPTLAAVPRVPGCDLSTEHPTMPLDPLMVECSWNALLQGQTHYVDVPGIPPLREALATYLGQMGIAGHSAGSVVVTAGMQEARFLSVQMIGAVFGKIALPAVVHPGARKAAGVRRLDVQALPVDAANGMLPTLDGIGQALDAGCRLLYLESPVRLTGAAFDAAALTALRDLVKKADAAVIWDQGLAPWAAAGQGGSLAAGSNAKVAVIGEAWPGVGLEALQVGYLGLLGEWLDSIRSQKQIMAICTSTPSQYAALKAPEVYARVHDAQRDQLAALRAEAADMAQKLGVEPLPGASASVLAVRPANAAAALRRLAAAGLAVADGADFGAAGVLRLAVTADNAIARALNVLSGAQRSRRMA
jgi:aspartate/methionine/tyrosine aminotransferase